MADNQQEENENSKAKEPIETVTINSKITNLKKLIKIFICIEYIFIWLIKKINYILSSCTIITQFIVILIPFSITCIILIFLLHITFYKNLYLFNFYKGIKEEFLDNYATELDDLHSELDIFVIKENYIDMENQLFFELYYKEMASVGLLNNPNKSVIPNINRESEKLYLYESNLNKINLNENDIYTISKNISKKNVDDRKDSIGELAKLYYYMFPIITYGAFSMNVIINQSFFIAYEFDENNKNIKNNELFFMYPRDKDAFNQNNNFVPNNYLLNPLVSKEHFEHSELINNSYYHENWFMKQDNTFRETVNISKDGYSQVSLAHLNNEHNENINKSLIISTQQYIKSNNRHYIVNIIFFLYQNISNKGTNEYSTFILKNNSNIEKTENEKYSDNDTFVILKSDITEYSLTTIDYQYFHYGLYEKNHNFFKNGISFDSFNLDYLYEPFDYYFSVDNFKIDFKYLSTLYLYKTLFQAIKHSIIQKKREEVFLFNFHDEVRVRDICKAINFKSYENYYEKSGINCWSKENNIYYNEDNYINLSMIDIYSIYPYCGCLPLFCLENYFSFYNNYNNIELASDISLPSKCQNFYISNEIENTQYSSKDININIKYSLYYKIISKLQNLNNDYIKFEIDKLSQLNNYYLLVVTQVKSSTNLFVYQFYTQLTYLDLIMIVLGITIISSVICLIIMYVNLRRYSIIIKEFKIKFDLYVFCSEDNKIINLYNGEKYKKYLNRKFDEFNNNDNIPLLQNDSLYGKDIYSINENSLLDDLFTMFCKHYKLSRKSIEKYYSQQKHETKNQMKLKMMMEKNELFRLLSMFSILAPIFKLNLSLDYKMYNYTKIIKKYDQYVSQVVNINKEQTRLTQNILYELLSTENISDYGLVSNLNFKYISNIKAELKENCIQNSMFKNVINRLKGKDEDLNEGDININDVFLIMKDGDEKQNIKLILKQKNELMEIFKNKFEVDDYLNLNKIESSFNFFLINSYYKYLKQIAYDINNN